MKKRTSRAVLCAALWPLATALAQPQAPLFDSVDENLNPVSMADMIDGRPLVLAVGSCT
ncbi:MAG: hypothetical protein SYC29_12585 [Planctomycetota bacterium]|nr:hypothetical protein [Planctomycetota bacterium]